MYAIIMLTVSFLFLSQQLQATLINTGVDVSLLERSHHPTRRIMVTRSHDGERSFAGFADGRAAGQGRVSIVFDIKDRSNVS